MVDLNPGQAKKRVNLIYKDYLLLEYYKSNLLKNSMPTQERKEALDKLKEDIMQDLKPHINSIGDHQKREIPLEEYGDGLKIVVECLSTDIFFECTEAINSILLTYESRLPEFINIIEINPMDRLKTTNMQLV